MDANSRQFIFNGVGTSPTGSNGSCTYVTNFGKYYVGDWAYIWVECVQDKFRYAANSIWFRLSSTGWEHCFSPHADGAGTWRATDAFIPGRKGNVSVSSVKSIFTNQWIYGMSTTSQTNQWGQGQGAKLWFSNNPKE